VSRPLDDVDLTATLSNEDSLARIEAAQRRLTHLRLFAAGLLESPEPGPGIIVVFEGFDAAGKGGAIRRVTAALDPRHVRVVPIGPPTPIEADHHFLWRFAEPLPARGAMTIFDRSWYGRLLVDRVEATVDRATLARSAAEIVAFERGLAEDGAIIVKFWLHVSDAEQLRRFLQRRDDPLKRWKLTDEDWRNRERREQYVEAVNDMIEGTDHPHARWRVVAAEDKRFARVDVLESLNRAIEHGLARHGLVVPASRGAEYLR
jgi:polyphosphate kinase 2 (PPK2 family)